MNLEETKERWLIEARELANAANLSGVIGRRKGQAWSVVREEAKTISSVVASSVQKWYVFDEVRVNVASNGVAWDTDAAFTYGECDGIFLDDSDSHLERTRGTDLVVKYWKPLDAFVHPNGGLMLAALRWIIEKSLQIAKNFRQNASVDGGDKNQMNGPSLLEMYCGFGAHTVPLALSGAFRSIVAIELDQS
eukprot:CAMPEP_0113320900 /NCGR_PEP_ID=MMETSP0010_2-20120614/14564_1 /TAXON_ID=216773 ORGANISM="Corethron hystrix, Strain 308" /NCGR_SAMPLE_ID=MMETSP0010_2 /ASSEMBLY_ACC=CAM_ASM_000155 /LENGTH=191 /DNA_ID=CAMNT_0000178855 /DNA_START=215 /DNA_END=790 /DNA_ORIENTATION=+ /assembly_acc=CAM_ASM_000155